MIERMATMGGLAYGWLAQFETLIALLRNGLCVVKDLQLVDSLQQPWDVAQVIFPGFTRLEALIAPLQLAAALFNGVSGLWDLSKGVIDYNEMHEWRKLLQVQQVSAEADEAQPYARKQVALEQDQAWRQSIMGCCKLTISFGFAKLTTNSLHMASMWWLNLALLLMEVALAYILVVMVRGAKSKKSASTLGNALASDLDELQKQAEDQATLLEQTKPKKSSKKSPTTAGASKEDMLLARHPHLFEDQETLSVLCAAAEIDPPRAPWPGPAERYLGNAYCHEVLRFRRELIARLTESPAEMADCLRANAVGDNLRGSLEVVYIVLNVIAWIGYAIFPLTWFYPDSNAFAHALAPYCNWPGHALAEWLGNFVGDLAWTVEPALVFLVLPVIQKAQAAKLEARSAARKKRT